MKSRGRFVRWVLPVLWVVVLLGSDTFAARIKDVASIKGIRNNQLVGYGLVVGLNGTGDKSGTGFTNQSLGNMIERLGVDVDKSNISVKNVAAVMVTAVIPPFARIGNKIDVIVSSVGDAKSLQGGTLLMTPLRGVDGKVYGLAQGPLSIGGFSAGGGTGVTKNHPTVGRIARGATIEREIPVSVQGKDELIIALGNPDFTTATRVRKAINGRFGFTLAKTIDSGTVSVFLPERLKDHVVETVATLENLEIVPDAVAKVIVNEKTGTVVVGEKVRISTVAVAHGNLSIVVREQTSVSQPSPLAPAPPESSETEQFDTGDGAVVAPGGSTVVTTESDVAVEEGGNRLLVVPGGSTIEQLVRALNAIGVTPRDLITIFQSIKAAGALHAELEII